MAGPSKASILLDAAEKISADFGMLLSKARVPNSGQARIAACLCLTIAEIHIAVLAVLRSQAQSHAPVLVRSMHEALADLRNLLADARYLDQMRFDNADQVLKTFKGFIDDPDLKDMEEALKFLSECAGIEQEIYDELKGKGLKPLGAAGKFKRANMAGEYATAYRFLCSFSHTDLNTLLARHAGNGHLRFTDPLPSETLVGMLGLALSLYAHALDTTPKYSDLSTDLVKGAIQAADKMWIRAVEAAGSAIISDGSD